MDTRRQPRLEFLHLPGWFGGTGFSRWNAAAAAFAQAQPNAAVAEYPFQNLCAAQKTKNFSNSLVRQDCSQRSLTYP
jgi:hypothetical protein